MKGVNSFTFVFVLNAGTDVKELCCIMICRRVAGLLVLVIVSFLTLSLLNRGRSEGESLERCCQLYISRQCCMSSSCLPGARARLSSPNFSLTILESFSLSSLWF